jgi:nifR3 family TIM-barrel protein
MPASALALRPLRIGPLILSPPVVLAPMAGVTDVPFSALCRRFGAGLYVNQMVTARGLVEGDRKTLMLARFGPGEWPRSIQLYGTDPRWIGEAVRLLVDGHGVDHIDMNFGCPMAKVTRHGGGAALPVKRRLLAAIVSSAVRAAGPVPVTVKFRLGVDDAHLTYLETGRIAEHEGAAAVALHARTAEQLYAPGARWEAIALLKQHVAGIPVLGNGDIYEASDALAMTHSTGCDGVVVGRGCLGRPWLFAELTAAFAGMPVPDPPRLGSTALVMVEHAAALAEWLGDGQRAMHVFRKHALWYLSGYPVGGAARRRIGLVSSLGQLQASLAALDPNAAMEPGALRRPRSHHHGPRPVVLPPGWLADPDEIVALPRAAEPAGSGG